METVRQIFILAFVGGITIYVVAPVLGLEETWEKALAGAVLWAILSAISRGIFGHENAATDEDDG